MPGFVAHGAYQWLNQQTRHRTRQIEQGQLRRISIQKRINGIDGGLLEPKTVLDSKEPKIHVDDLSKIELRLECGHKMFVKMVAKLFATK